MEKTDKTFIIPLDIGETIFGKFNFIECVEVAEITEKAIRFKLHTSKFLVELDDDYLSLVDAAAEAELIYKINILFEVEKQKTFLEEKFCNLLSLFKELKTKIIGWR